MGWARTFFYKGSPQVTTQDTPQDSRQVFLLTAVIIKNIMQ